MASWFKKLFKRGDQGDHQLLVDIEAAQKPKRSDLAVLKQLFVSYVWRGDFSIKFRVVVAFSLMLASKIFNVLIPQTYKQSVDSLSAAVPVFPLLMILAYGLLRLLSTGSDNLRDAVFVRVQQEAVRASSLDVFNHLHNLSLRFHTHRQTGGVLRAVERGTSGISFLLQFLLFNILPTFVELILVCFILLGSYVIWFSVITLVVIASYVAFTITITEWRNKFRREQNELNSTANNIAVDSLLNFETVKYFSNEQHEAGRYDSSLRKYVEASVKSQTSLALLNVGQSAIIAVGLAGMMLLAAREHLEGRMTVGDFVAVNTYLLQLYIPLNFLGTSYRMIKTNLVDLEQMFELLDENQEVKDAPDAEPLYVDEGTVEFKDVVFSYDQKVPVLSGVSFTVKPGQLVAVVGPTGAGKSTISRLLFRFYDITDGQILIDGHDIKTVTQESLRRQIGVVPQDTVLFNDTIEYNIRYGRPSATDDEVIRAAQMARIHDFVLSLPDGYKTKVGERGLRLSGGEKQRVSIARAILKNPQIMIFDEATSALDTKTEKEIQKSLHEVSKGRTTVVIAHRLSTIIDADEIIVLKGGKIAERGSHYDLLEKQGEYYSMWIQQTQDEAKGHPQEKHESELPLIL